MTTQTTSHRSVVRSAHKLMCFSCNRSIEIGEEITQCIEAKGMNLRKAPPTGGRWVHYLCAPIDLNTQFQIEMWKEEQINLLETNKYIPKEEKYWKITRYECTLVKRDKEWWSNVVGDIYQFYNDLLYYKTDNNVEILKKRVAEKNSKKKVYHVADVIDDFCLISDEEDNSENSNSS